MDILTIYILLVTCYTISRLNGLRIIKLFKIIYTISSLNGLRIITFFKIYYVQLRLTFRNFRNIIIRKLYNEGNDTDNSKYDIDQTLSFKCISAGNSSEQIQTKEQAMNLCVQILDKQYSGDPMTLSAFIDSINLLEDLINDTNIDILRRFILCRLVGDAQIAVMGQTSSITDIKASLRKNIKPITSKRIEALLLSLQYSFSNYSRLTYENVCNFTHEIEKLSNFLRYSYIYEGCTLNTANQLTIERIVKLCREITRSELVHTILAASPFDSYEEVISKFLTETMKEISENGKRNFDIRFSHNKSYIRNFHTLKTSHKQQCHPTTYNQSDKILLPSKNGTNSQVYRNRQTNFTGNLRQYESNYSGSRNSNISSFTNRKATNFNPIYTGRFSPLVSPKNEIKRDTPDTNDKHATNFQRNTKINSHVRNYKNYDPSCQNLNTYVKRNDRIDNGYGNQIPSRQFRNTKFNLSSTNYSSYKNFNTRDYDETKERNHINNRQTCSQTFDFTQPLESKNNSAKNQAGKPSMSFRDVVKNAYNKGKHTNPESSLNVGNKDFLRHLPFNSNENNSIDISDDIFHKPDTIDFNKVTIEDLYDE